MSQANIATVQSLYAAFGRGEIGTILDACAPDIEWVTVGQRDAYPTFGARKTIPEVQEFFNAVAATHDFDEFSPREFYADKDKVFAVGHYALTVKKNARKAASDWVHIFTFRGGKVQRFQEFTDTASFAAAFAG